MVDRYLRWLVIVSPNRRRREQEAESENVTRIEEEDREMSRAEIAKAHFMP